MNELHKLVLVGLGGFLGAISRYAIGAGLHSKFGDGFAWGTLAVNVLGCFLMGLLIGAGFNSNHRTFVLFGIGFLGSLTTFSAFSADFLRHASDGRLTLVTLHVAGNVVLSLAAAWAGLALARSLQLGAQGE